jgi:hypothetical protein
LELHTSVFFEGRREGDTDITGVRGEGKGRGRT